MSLGFAHFLACPCFESSFDCTKLSHPTSRPFPKNSISVHAIRPRGARCIDSKLRAALVPDLAPSMKLPGEMVPASPEAVFKAHLGLPSPSCIKLISMTASRGGPELLSTSAPMGSQVTQGARWQLYRLLLSAFIESSGTISDSHHTFPPSYTVPLFTSPGGGDAWH
jgi:hypothetical protein